MHAEVLSAAQALERTGFRYPHTNARLGADSYAFVADWLDQLAVSTRSLNCSTSGARRLAVREALPSVGCVA